MLVMTAFIVLVGQGKVPAWIVAIIVCRELAVTGLRLLLVEHGEVMAAAWPGKVKQLPKWLQLFYYSLTTFHFSTSSTTESNHAICRLIFTIYSGVDYFAKNKDVLKVRCKRESNAWLVPSVFLFSLNQLMGCKIKQSGKIFI